MKWFKRLLAHWAYEGREMLEQEPDVPRHYRSHITEKKASTNGGCNAEFKNPLNITLYNAVGGRIVKFTRYDRSNDEVHETTYIISSEENFEESLGKCISMESLKHVG